MRDRVIELGEEYRDLDYRSYRDTEPDETGNVGQEPRVVVVDDVDRDYVYVTDTKTGRQSRILKTSFFESSTNSRGRRRSQGFVPADV